MANLDDESEGGVSLFPMFNILACTLGVMVFVLATVAVVSLGADKAVELVAEGSISAFTFREPTWVEWNGLELIVHPTEESVEFPRDLRSIETFEETYQYMFQQLAGTRVGARLAEVAGDDGRYIILLVRPSGFRTLPEVRGYFGLLGVDVVEEPIDQDWRRLRVR